MAVAATPPDDPAREAWALIAQLFFGDEVQQRFHAACASIDATPPMLKALLSMEPGEAQSMRALAQDWRCDASWVTNLIDSLEERNLVERKVLPTDRRVKTVEITEAGEKARARALDTLYEPPERLTSLPRRDQESLRDALKKLTQ